MPRKRVDAEALSRLWTELHRRALDYSGDAAAEREWLDQFAKRVPCGECRTHWQKIIAETPPDLSSRDNYFAWTVAAHNAVNRKLGRAEMAVDDAREEHAGRSASLDRAA